MKGCAEHTWLSDAKHWTCESQLDSAPCLAHARATGLSLQTDVSEHLTLEPEERRGALRGHLLCQSSVLPRTPTSAFFP